VVRLSTRASDLSRASSQARNRKMNFGIPIDNNFLRTLPEYKGKPDSELTARDRSKVAIQQRDVYVSEAVKRLDELKSDYGNGVR
jgi:hypothetical protein